MRIRAIHFMALTACLLLAGSGCTRAKAAPEDGSDETASPPPESSPVSIASESLETGEQTPPSTPPEPAPSALETSPAPETVPLNPALQGVVKLLRSGVEEKVVLNYIGASDNPFEVDSDAIIYLTDLGASGAIINAMMERDKQLRSGQGGSASESHVDEPWPPAGTVAEVPASDNAAPPGEETVVATDDSSMATAPAETVTVDYFQTYLAPYGAWVQVPGYGLCWQPTVAVSCAGWTPYCDRGRWVYTDYGWYWYSDYTWGWAAFHYGRWFHHSRWGWCWMPGTVWGPSWVSWRYAGSYCGWAPLPPYSSSGFYFSVGISWGIPSWCYTYVPSYRICANNPRSYCIPRAQALPIHRRSSIRNHYAVAPNATIENRGIPPEDLSDNPARDIHRARIEPRHEVPRGGVRRERLARDGETLTVYQPDRRHRAKALPTTSLNNGLDPVRRAATTSSRSDRTTLENSLEPSSRRLARDSRGMTPEAGATSMSEEALHQRAVPQSRTPLPRSRRAAGGDDGSADRSLGSTRGRNVSVREDSFRRPDPSISRNSAQDASARLGDKLGTARTRPDTVQSGPNRPNSQRAFSAATPTRIGSPDRSSTTLPASVIRNTEARSRQPGSAAPRNGVRVTTPATIKGSAPNAASVPLRTYNKIQAPAAPNPRTIRVAPAASSTPSMTAPSRSVTTAPRGSFSVPQYRPQNSVRGTVSASPQPGVPPRGPAHAVSSPGRSVRSAPSFSSAPSVRGNSSTLSAPPSAPRNTVRSAPAPGGRANNSRASRNGR